MPMYCHRCGIGLPGTARFCSNCGATVMTAGPIPGRPLVRPHTGRQIAGVCLGLAQANGWDVAVVRIITVITFFFSGGREEPFEGEERILIPSPKVATYDLQPEMSAPEVTDRIVEAIENQRYDVIVVNYANGDMVGHTGVLPAAVKAVEVVDQSVGQILNAVQKQGGLAIVTADHGNCEQMIDPATGGPHTAHTTYDVPLILVDDRLKGKRLHEGARLADLAPTALQMLGLPIPPEMTGRPLFD